MKITRLDWAGLTLVGLGLGCLFFHFQTTLMIYMETPQLAVTMRPDTRPDEIKYKAAWALFGWVASVLACLGCFAGAFFTCFGVFGGWENSKP